MITIRHVVTAALLASATLTIGPAPEAQASQVVRAWYDGNWTCRIDGRPARMRWEVRSKNVGSCSGGVCSTAQVAYYHGLFSDNGSRWVTLTRVNSSSSHLMMRHADGNTWRLDYQGGRAQGWTTWNGRRYPLSCHR